MAKLECVKVLDMVGGEITKVAYDGAEYVKVDDVKEPVDGDIAVNNQESPSYTEGAFYELQAGLSEFGSFITKLDDDGYADNGKHPRFWTVFRKVSASKPTIDERVDSLEKRVDALEEKPESPKQSFKVGDYIVGNDESRYGITNDKMALGKVVKEITDGYDDIRVEVLRHATEPDEIGKGFGVQSKYFRKATAEEIADYEESLKPTFKTGDIVVITGNTNSSRNAVGDIGKVGMYVSKSGADVDVLGKTSGNGNYTLFNEMRHATQAEREQYEESLKPKLKAGDWVKFASYTGVVNSDGITLNKAYNVHIDANSELTFVDDDGDNRSQPIEAKEAYEIVAPPSVFERIGRNEGEFKVGDVVRVTGSALGHNIGTIGVIEYDSGWGKLRVRANGELKSHAGQMELIAPVENRVDIPCV